MLDCNTLQLSQWECKTHSVDLMDGQVREHDRELRGEGSIENALFETLDS